MGWFGFGGRKSSGSGSSPPPAPAVAGDQAKGFEDAARVAEAAVKLPPAPEQAEALATAGCGMREHGGASEDAAAAAASSFSASEKVDDEAATLSPTEAQEGGYVDRLKAAVSGSFDSAKKAPETIEEAMAVFRGERDVKPDYERAVYTVSAAFGGGCVHGWWNGAALAAKYPPHQRSLVRVRTGARSGVRFAVFALIFEGSSAALEALRRKRDFMGGAAGGGLAGMAYGVSGGLAAARRGLFYGVWLGGVFGFFRNHVASLKDQARLRAEEEARAEEERDAIGKMSLRRSIKGLDEQLKTWPEAEEDGAQRQPSQTRRG